MKNIYVYIIEIRYKDRRNGGVCVSLTQPLQYVVQCLKMEMEIDQAELVEEIKNKTILHWNYRDYEKLPESLKHWGIHVQELYLKENKLSSLPQWINQLSNITNLYLSGNKFIKFPHELSIMTRLTVLDLSDNNIRILPASIQNLKSMKDLNLDGNCLHQLPLGKFIFIYIHVCFFLSNCKFFI